MGVMVITFLIMGNAGCIPSAVSTPDKGIQTWLDACNTYTAAQNMRMVLLVHGLKPLASLVNNKLETVGLKNETIRLDWKNLVRLFRLLH